MAGGIETNKLNYTRFLVLHRAADYNPPKDANKASVRFEAAHRPGSLARILDVLSRYDVNMTKLQSVPILGRPYQYSFHVDLEWPDSEKFRAAISELRTQTTQLIQFGEYRAADKDFTAAEV